MATAALERNLLLASVRPLSYEVLLEPHFDKQVSTGNVKIRCAAVIRSRHQLSTCLAENRHKDVMF